MGIEAGEQAGAAGTTAGGVAEVREANPGTGQAIDVGRADLTSVAAHIAEAHVVRQNDDDVGTILWCRKRMAGAECTGRREFYEVPAEDQGPILPPKELS